MSNTTTYVLLIRHGENDWVGSNRLAGRTPGVFLNDRGRQQAVLLAERLSNQPVHAVYSSPLERCMETAQPLADAFGLSVVAEPGIIEVDYGEWQGGKLQELAKSPEWRVVQQNPSSFRFPGGESFLELQHRAVSTIERIRHHHPDQLVVLFSHGDVIRTTMAHYMGTPLDLFQRIIASTASISAITFHGHAHSVPFVNQLLELPKFEFKQPEDQKSEK